MIYKPYWFKTTICTMIGVTTDILEDLISDETKKAVDWKKGIQKFKDGAVILILKDLFPAKNDAEIREMIGYKAQLNANSIVKKV